MLDLEDPLDIVVDPDSKIFKDRVQAELFRMATQEEAERLYALQRAKVVPIPTPVKPEDVLPKAVPELLKGILLASGATGIIGEKETGKSLTALEIQYSLLTGTPLWGDIKPVKGVSRTVHFLAEHTSQTLQELYQRTKMPSTGGINIYGPELLGPYKLLVSNGTRREQAIGRYKKMAEGAGLIVFDPMAAFIQGEAAENDNNPMRNLIDTMIEIAESAGAACLVLGHQGKPKFTSEGHKIQKNAYATRGASGTEDALTAVHYLERCEGELFNQCPVYRLRAVHYKGRKHPPFKFYRDNETCRQILLTKAVQG